MLRAAAAIVKETGMSQPISRRWLLGAMAGAGAGGAIVTAWTASARLPLTDYHVHLDEVVTLEKAIEVSHQRGVKFGIVEHAGRKPTLQTRRLSTDEDLLRYIAKLEGKPVLKGIQAEGLDWPACFSTEVVARLDYVLSDALTLPGNNGEKVELWRPGVKVDDPQEFMDRYTAFTALVMTREPIDILANPTFLPACLEKDYDSLWTRRRMNRIIETAATHDVAIEINSRYRIPSLAFLSRANRAGLRFSFGSNIHGLDIGRLDYCLEIAKELRLSQKNLFRPAPPGAKPIQSRAFL
jgi:histidinol phosphatase-like PHP family hydrolase